MKNFIQKNFFIALCIIATIGIVVGVSILNHYFTSYNQILGSAYPALKINQLVDPIGTGFIYSNGTGTSTLISSSTISVSSGGTGATSFTNNKPIVYSNGIFTSSSTLSVVVGGTGLSTLPLYGQILIGNSGGGYTLTATSSIGISNYFTNINTSTSLNTGSVLSAGSFYATSSTATSTFSNILVTGTADLTNALLGPLNFPTDGGVNTWTDLPQVSATNGSTQSYTAKLGGNSALTIYGKADGAGGITNLGVGIGTTSPSSLLSLQGNTLDLLLLATSTRNPVGGVDKDGHRFTSGPTPAISSCGTGTGTVVGDDSSGVITTATSATACTATFAKAYAGIPTCIVTDDSLVGFADVASVSTTAVTFGISSALTGGKLYYQCLYHR